MPDWLGKVVEEPELELSTLCGRLALAALLGCLVAAIYRYSHRRGEPIVSSFIPTLVLLTIILALVPQVIGGNVARAFSLVGALSIVRFRTVVQDTRDTAFVIFAVVMGMAVGTGHFWSAALCLVFMAAASFVVRPARPRLPRKTSEWTLAVRLAAGSNPDALLGETLARNLDELHLTAAGTAKQGTAMDLTYSVRLKPGKSPNAMMLELNQLEGVQSVDLRRG